MRHRPASRRLLALAALSCVALGGTACLGYPAEGMVGTPPQPTTTGQSRLPQLLSQLQGQNGAGLELFDGSQNQVLAAQDEETEGKGAGEDLPDSTATPAATVAGTRTAGTATATPPARGEDLSNQTPPPEKPGATATPAGTSAVTQTATPTPTGTATPSPTATPTPAPSGPPSEGDGPAGLPETE